MSDLLDQNSITSTLFKKYKGFVNTSSQKAVESEYNVNAYPFIYKNKIFSQEIPATAPSSFSSSTSLIDGSSQRGTKRIPDGSYNYIVKYEDVLLKSLDGSDKAFVYENEVADRSKINILSHAINTNYGNGGYIISVKEQNNQTIYSSNYIFDYDAGVLTIYDTPSVNNSTPPKISFWRYEGKIGVLGDVSSDDSLWYTVPAKSTVDMCSNIIKNVADPVAKNDAVNKKYVDEISNWISRNILDQPPAPDISAVETTKREIRVRFTNPLQIQSGLMQKPLPIINALNVDLSMNGDLSSLIIKNEKYIPELSGINGFILTKQGGSGYRMADICGVQTQSYYYRNDALIFKLNDSSGQLDLWYENWSGQKKNKLSVLIGPFLLGSPPTPPQNLSVSSITETSSVLSWSKPALFDRDEFAEGPDGEVSYLIDVSFNSSIRYPSPYSGAITSYNYNIGLTNSTNLSQALSGLYAGNEYNVKVKAKNTLTNIYSDPSSIVFSTSYPAVPSNVNELQFSSGVPYITLSSSNKVYKYIDKPGEYNDDIVKLLRKNLDAETLSFNQGIETESTAGILGKDNAELLKLMVYEEKTNKSSISYKFGGFAATDSNIDSANNLIRIIDNGRNNFGSTEEQQGFYRELSGAKIKLFANVFDLSSASYTLTVSGERTGSSAINVVKQFRIDDFNSTALSIAHVEGHLDELTDFSNYIKVSGISILKNIIPTITYKCRLTNLLNYHYPKNLIDYVLKAGSTEISTVYTIDLSESDHTVGTVPAELNLEFTKTTQYNVNASDIFSTRLGPEITARSLTRTISNSLLFRKNVIVDTKTVRFINDVNIYPATVPKINSLNAYAYGQHMDYENVDNTYNNNKVLDQSYNALQIVEGAFRTKGSNAYLDYSGTEFNPGIKYSALPLPQYRYAAFKVNFEINDSFNYVNLKLMLNSGINTFTIPDSGQNETMINGSIPFEFYYKFSGFSKAGTPYNSVWINANTFPVNNATPTANFANDYNNSAYDRLIGGRVNAIRFTTSTDSINYKLLILPQLYDFSLYVYIGLPTSLNLDIKGIQMGLSLT